MSDVSSYEDDDGCDEASDEPLYLPPEVQSAIEQVLPHTDALDHANFEAVDYINSLFPTEQSLSNIDDVINELEHEVHFIDSEIRTVVRGQTNVGQEDGRSALEAAQKMIRLLAAQVSDIKRKAEVSEEAVGGITQDIKRLDAAKRNLTAAITTLNHLHILVTGLDTLKVLIGKRRYSEIVMPLQAITEVMTHFNTYTNITLISNLADEVKEVQSALVSQITEDFHEAFAGPNARNFMPNKELAEACLVISVLDSKVKSELLKWFVDLQLGEYRVLFQESEDAASLDKIDRRYAWFKRHLLQCEDRFGAMFPPSWHVSERITVQFCRITKAELSKILSKRRLEIDDKLLLYAIQRTASMEELFARRFTGVTLLEEAGASAEATAQLTEKPKLSPSKDTAFADDFEMPENDSETVGARPSGKSAPPTSPFHGIIGECFQPYLYIYINSLDRNLSELLERFVGDARRDLGHPMVGEGGALGLLPSCADLFVFYKKCLVQCTGLSTGHPMLGLASTFQKYLREYAGRVLQANLPKLGSSTALSSATAGMTTLTRDLRDLSTGLIQNFLKDGDAVRYSKQDLARICSILTTAEYCLETTQQLEEKLREKVDPTLAEKINMAQEQDVFHNVISNAIQLLVQDLELACEPALLSMCKIQWQSVSSVGDQSSYVSTITLLLKSAVPMVRANLASSRKYFTQFCIKFANCFIPKYIHTLYKCKPLTEIAAEQLLLDTHMLKTVLMELPCLGSQVQRKSPASFTKVVVKGMTRAEMILKVVMAPTENDLGFVDQFLNLLPDSDLQEFQKILEMKSLKTTERNHLVSIFRPRDPSGFITGGAPSSPKHDTSSIRKLNNLIKQNFVASSKE